MNIYINKFFKCSSCAVVAFVWMSFGAAEVITYLHSV